VEKKFLLISQVFYPDEVSTASLFTGLCTSLVKQGVPVEVWAGQPSYTKLTRQPGIVNHNGMTIRYLASTNFHKSSLPGRFLNILSFTFSVCLKLLFEREKTPVWAHTTPPFTGIFASAVCHLRNRKFIYILLDIFPEGLVRLGKLSGRNPFVKLWEWMFIKALDGSEKIIAIGRDIKELVGEKNRALTDKTEYIPHWHDDDAIFPIEVEKNHLISEFGLNDKFLVQYSGNMGLWNEMKTIGMAVNKTRDDVVFIFVGGGMRKPELINEFSVQNPANVIMLPFQEDRKFNESLNASHVHLVTLKDNLEGIAVPCKIYGILAAGKPVIGMVPENSEIGLVIKEEKCGILLHPDDLQGLLNAITFLKENDGARHEMGINSRRAFERKYKVGLISERYKTLLDTIY
jgi:glycosyltransferase involved in cell wall biosynthesis